MRLRTERNRWWIVLGGALGCAVNGGVVIIYTLGIFANAYLAEFGWDRSVHAFCLTFFLLASGFGTVWLGGLIRRHGVRRPSIALIVVFAAAVALLAALPPAPPLFYLTFAVIGLSGAAATAMPYAVAVAGWFDRNRGLALGLISTGTGIGTVLGPQFARFFQEQFGWRVGILATSIVVALVALFSLLFLVREPPPRKEEPAARQATVAFVKRRHFWLIALPVLGISVTVFGVTGSFVPLFTDYGFSAATVATVMSASGLSSWVGRVLVGYLMDRIFAPFVAAFTFLLALVGVVLLATGESFSIVLAGAVLIGFALGAESDVVTFLASRYFSMAEYSQVLGALWVMWAWGGGIGTAIVGLTFRATHSYDTACIVFSILLVMSAFLICRLGPYEYRPGSQG